MRKMQPSETAWFGLVVYALAYDIWAWRNNKKTMSIQFGDWLATPQGRKACIIVWTTLTAHLFWGLPLPGQTKLKIAATKQRKWNS